MKTVLLFSKGAKHFTQKPGIGVYRGVGKTTESLLKSVPYFLTTKLGEKLSSIARRGGGKSDNFRGAIKKGGKTQIVSFFYCAQLAT